MSQRDLMDEWSLVTHSGWEALKGLGKFGLHSQESGLLGTLSADCCGRRALVSLGVDTEALREQVLAAIKADTRELPTDGSGAVNRALPRAVEAAQSAGLDHGAFSFQTLGILREGVSTASELLRGTGVEDAALEAALVREIRALLAKDSAPPEPDPAQTTPSVVGPTEPALDPERNDPTGTLRLVRDAFAALQAGDLEGHLAHVRTNVLSGEHGARLGVPAYRNGLHTLLTCVLPKGSPEFALHSLTPAANGVTWVHAGWWLTYPHPQNDTNIRVFHGYRVAVKGGKIVAVHSARRDDKGVDLPEWRACAICKAALPHDTPELLCAEHAAERDQRLAGPLPLAELSQRWGDTLARVAGLPPALRDEPLAADLELGHPYGPWQLFSAGGHARDRWLIWRPDTGEVRRYAGNLFQSLHDYLDDLALPPPEATDQGRWLNLEPHAPPAHWFTLDFILPRRWLHKTHEPVRPVHVLPTPPSGMSEAPGGTQFSGNDWTVTWRYEASVGAEPRWLAIISAAPLHGRHQPLDRNPKRPLDESTDTLWARLVGRAPWEPQVTDRGPLELTLGSRTFTGEMIRPNVSRSDLQFILRCPDLFLFGDSHGLSMDELAEQLRRLVDESDNPQLAEERKRRLEAEQMAEMERRNPGMLAEWEKTRQARVERQANRDPNEVIPTAFQLLTPELAKLAEQHPAAWLVSLQASFVEESWDSSDLTIGDSSAPHWWSASAWIGPERPRPAAAPVVWAGPSWWRTARKARAFISREAGVRLVARSCSRRPTVHRPVCWTAMRRSPPFSSTARPSIVSRRAPASPWCSLPQNKTAAPSGGASFWRVDQAEYLALIIDAHTGELLHSEVTNHDH